MFRDPWEERNLPGPDGWHDMTTCFKCDVELGRRIQQVIMELKKEVTAPAR
jgi:hypothetical protein